MSIAKEGFPFILIPLVIGVLLLVFGRSAWLITPGVLLVLFSGFCIYFFRDPVRQIPAGENLIVAPCDGTVMEVLAEGDRQEIRMFLSVFNVHLQRSPFAGTVTGMVYQPGKCVPAMRPDAHCVNEQNIITLQTAKGELVVKQIAGILARRVVSWVKPGDTLTRGQHIGLIKFGSQVDLSLPANCVVKLKIGDKVTGGETVIAEFK